jgi:hypothetical protein
MHLMPHWKSMFDDKEFLFAFDLGGREVTVTIERCTAGQIIGEQGRKSKKPMLSFVGKQKKLALNKTNGKIIAAMYGNETSAWAGKSIIIFPATTTFGSETVECIRVKPIVPAASNGKRGKQALAEQPSQSVIGDVGTDLIDQGEPEHDETTGEVAE